MFKNNQEGQGQGQGQGNAQGNGQGIEQWLEKLDKAVGRAERYDADNTPNRLR